jgi:hypothetical protein
MMTRRMVLVGGGVAAAAVIAGGAVASRILLTGPRSAESDAADYAKLLAEVHDDYVNGRVVEHEGWVLSQHEFDTLASRQHAAARTSTSVS